MRKATMSLIGTEGIDALRGEIIEAITAMNKKKIDPKINHIIALTSARNRTSVIARLTLLERHGYIRRQRKGFPKITVLKPNPKVLTADLETMKRKPKPKVTPEIKAERKSHAVRCFEQAVAMGLARDAGMVGCDPLHNTRSLFPNGKLIASKVG